MLENLKKYREKMDKYRENLMKLKVDKKVNIFLKLLGKKRFFFFRKDKLPIFCRNYYNSLIKKKKP